MFEKLVESVLEEYVSEWVDGLDAEKMKVALFGGKVEFRDLRLKTSALEQFELPLTVKAGTLGRLSLKVPWKRLTKEAVTIHVEDLTLLVVPAHEEELRRHPPPASRAADEDDAGDSYALRIRWAKQQEVRVRELLEKNRREEAAAPAPADGSGDTTAAWGYRDRILHNILDNVSFEFSRIHVRYEDTTQLLAKNPLALGVTIDALTVTTTNANGHVAFIDRAQSHTPFVHKTLEMRRAGLYCDDTSSVQELTSVRRAAPHADSYIIHPFNTSVKMTVNHDETTAFSIPKLQFVGDIGSINASVTPDQCNDLISVINFVSTHEVFLKRIHCRRKRPTVPVKRNAKKWWKYALIGVQVMYSLPSRKLSGLSPGSAASSLTRFNTPKPPCDWKLFGVLWRYQHEYIRLHKKLLRAVAKKVAVESMTTERRRLDELEDILDVDSIVFFRVCAVQELELEETRHDSSKKLSNWKARWNARSHKDEGAESGSGLRALDPLEKLALYSTISEQRSASSRELADKKLDVKGQAILFAIDVAISSVRLSLVEHSVYDSSATSSTREFLQFELQQFLFAIFQRNGSSSISSSIQSVHMLDFSQIANSATGERQSQPLFYSLASSSSHTESEQGNSKKPDLDISSKPAAPQPVKKFLELKVEASDARFALDCSLEPFRYIHNLSVAAKLQTYFVAQVDVAPALKENAEDALAYSSEWLNKAVFAGASAARQGNRTVKRSHSEATLQAKRTVEFSIRLPEVDVLVLTSDTSPILQARLLALEFKSGNLLDTFAFSIKGVSILFYDEANALGSTDAEAPPLGAKMLRHQGGLKDVRQASQKVTQCDYDLSHRHHSTILKKTRLVFDGEQIAEANRPPRWSVKCTAPPIYFTLSSAQYRQPTNELAIDLVLDIKQVNVEARFSSSAQAIAVDVHSLAVFKRLKAVSGSGKNEKISTAEAIAKVNETLAKTDANRHDDERPSEPDPAYDPLTDNPTCKLLEIGPKVRFTLRNADPFDGKIWTQQVVLYWDQALLVALFRSYFLGNSSSRSATSSRSSSRKSSGKTAQGPSNNTPSASASVDANAGEHPIQVVDPPGLFGIELHVERWFIFCRPDNTLSKNFALKLYGRELLGDISTLRTPYLVVKIHVKGGATLESSRLTTESFGISSPETETATPPPTGTGEDVCELLTVNEPITVTVESAGYGVLPHRTSAATYVHILGSGVAVNYVNAHYAVFADYMQNQLISFFNWISVQTQPPDVVLVDERTKLEADITNVRLFLPRGAVGNPVVRQKKPERMEVDVAKVRITSRPHPDCPRMEQLRIQVDDVRISTCMIDSDVRLHTDAVGSVDEAAVAAEEKASRLTVEQRLAAAKTTMFCHKAVFVEFVALPIVESEKQAKRRRQREAERRAVRRTSGGFKDIEDVATEMEKLCAFVKVSLHRPSDWFLETDAGSVTHRTGLRIETPHVIDLALDLQQLELCGCILNENLGESEVLPRARPFGDAEDEFQALEVQVLIGDVNLSVLSSNTIRDYRTKRALGPDERAIVQVNLSSVKVIIHAYSTERAQYRVLASKASLWLVDDTAASANDESDGENDDTPTAPTRTLTACAEMYPSADNGSEQCIDVTIDDHPPPADPTAPRIPQDIRVHVETCALTPSVVHLASRVGPFLFGKSKVPFYSPTPAGPVNVSVTTGVVHCMFAHYAPGSGAAANTSREHQRRSAADATDDDATLHLIMSGCFVVRYSNADSGLQHVQVFGRKMSFEIAAQWPPRQDVASAIAAIPSPSPSPTRSPVSPRVHRGSLTSASASHTELLSLANYRRVLCDDFAIDMDLIDTMAAESMLKISASLTHFHCVLCTFDVFMFTQIANFDFEDKRLQTRLDTGRESERESGAASTAAAPEANERAKRSTEIVVNTILEDASVTFVREIGEYFTPVARIHTYCAMCKVRMEMPPKAESVAAADASSSDSDANVVEIALHFSEDTNSELQDDEGMSVWGFNTLLGSWEPLVEPWTFALGVNLLDNRAGRVVTSIDLSGSDVHSLSVNCSPSLLDSLCAIAKEMEQLVRDPSAVKVSTASIISCGFYLANDCGAEISYWVSDSGAASHSTRGGFSYAPKQKRAPELLLARHKVPLKLSTALFNSLPADQTVSFSWGDEDWHPLTDVRIHSAGKYVYSVLPRTKAAAAKSQQQDQQPPVLLALFDISSVFGYRTLTVSSLVRVFNETDVAVDCGILAEDGKSVIEIGTIEPHDACGVPISLVRAIAAVRVLVRPHRADVGATPTLTKGSRNAPPASGARGSAGRDHRWSNELFISEKEDCTEHYASCSLILDDYDCRCQRMFDGSQPLHVSQICRSNGSFFRVWNRTFAASNASSLRYSQMRVLPPLTFDNKCGIALFVVVFVFKKVRRAGAHDREYFHLVASEKIPPRSSMQFLASSLHENTYCAVSMTGFSWSKLFLLPAVFPQPASAAPSSSNESVRPSAGGHSSPASSTASSSMPASPASPRSTDGSEVLCTLSDFRSRQATINVAFVSSSQELNAMRKVIIQPRFVIHNDTPLALTFEPRAKVKSNLSTAKTFFGLKPSAKKPQATCCGSSQLELIHSKLNALNGATTTAASPTARSTMFKRSPSIGTPAAAASGQSRAAVSTQEEMELFYCSESNFLDVQIEGNTAPSSGVQQFRLDVAMGGANSSLRLFDESKRHWCDLVVILEQVDSYTTKVTFVERYLVLNRTPHVLMCMPAIDIVASSSHSRDRKTTQAPPSGSSTPENVVILQPNATTAFNWCKRPSVPSDSCVRLKLQGVGDGNVTGWRWSGRFSLHEVSETALKLSNKYTNQVHVLRVEIRVESSVRVYAVLTSEDAAPFPLYRVVNSTAGEMVHFKQSFDGGGGDLAEQAAAASELNRGVTQRLLPGESICLGWDEAYFLQSLERVLAISYSSETTHSKILLDQPGEAQRIDIPASKTKPAYQVYLHWYLNGVTKTVHVHDTELPRDKLTGKQNAPPTASERTGSGGVLQLAATLVSELNLTVKLPSILLSVLNSKPEEVLLFSGEKLELAYAKTVGVHDQCEVKIGSFQLDNQLDNAVFPVIFTPIPSSAFSSMSFMDSPRKQARPMTPPTLQERKKSSADESDDAADDVDQFLHVSIFRLSYGADVEYIKYFSAMLQPARVQVDDFLILSAASLFSDYVQVVLHHFPPAADNEHRAGGSEAPSSPHATPKLERGRSASHGAFSDPGEAKIPPVERRMYIETLQLHPVRVHLTFQQNNLSAAPFLADSDDALLLPMVFLLLKSNLVNIDSAALNLNALHIFHAFTTRAFMVSTVQQHYAFQGVLQIYALVGAADILGNPIGLVTNLGTGVKDFFYEPAAGMVKSPQEFVLGLSRGTASLVKNSVYGTFNAASKFTGTLSSGIAALSMDAKYITERNSRNRHEVPTHLGTGLLYGTKQLGQGILAGVSGVITAPAMGAYTNGLSGFVEGVGKGLLGVAVKPTAGILDLAARTTAGITATATVFDRKARNTRVRLPRMLHTSDKRLRVYSGDEAALAQLLVKLPQRLLANEHYEAHVFLPLSRAVVATSHQFLHVDFSSAGAVALGPSPPRVTWKCPLTSVWGAQKTSRGVSVLIGTATNVQVSPAMNTLVTKSSMSTVLIPLRDTDALVADRVLKCVADLVARQRQRATPESETYATPPPRNSIGLVLEPVRDGERMPRGFDGSGGHVVDVFVGSACFRAGVEVGDVVVGFGGKKFERGDHGSALRYQLSLMKKGDTLELMVLRGGELRTMRVATE